MSIAQHILASLDGPTVTPLVKKLITDHKIFGFILFKRNIENTEHLIALNNELKQIAREVHYEIVIAVDQEGGRVARLTRPDFSAVPPMRAWGDRYNSDLDLNIFYNLGQILASEVKLAGFNLNFAPTVDVDINPQSPVIGDRSFSGQPGTVYKIAAEFIKGHKDQHVIPCLKHFPGHGATTKDSHLELPHDFRNKTEIKNTDLLVYEKLMRRGQAPSIMTAHVIYPDFDKEYPATLSQIIIEKLLREEMDFKGVIFSDDLMMRAIADHYPLLDAAIRFFLIGGDIAILGKNTEKAFEIIDELDTLLSGAHNLDKLADLKEKLARSIKRITTLKNEFSEPCRDSTGLDFKKTIARNQKYINQLFGIA
ncbi:MAG: beta-N-acetylhexosaminidase [Deltaproteobacteria bacterium]|nr:beta-N-acetylhexosaminidase [Deltaproteobacteria bacterium]